jgi:hypothetical protein
VKTLAWYVGGAAVVYALVTLAFGKPAPIPSAEALLVGAGVALVASYFVKRGARSRAKTRAGSPAKEATVLPWSVDGVSYPGNVLAGACPRCGRVALTELPPPVLAKQAHGTTHLCHPALGGCNHGVTAGEPKGLRSIP